MNKVLVLKQKKESSKARLNLYVSKETITKAKAKGINLSATVEKILKKELR